MSERLRLDLRYDGSGFHGWAKQDGLRTVQGEIEQALATIFGETLTLTVAGRTDAGVHASSQVAHVDVPTEKLSAIGLDEDGRARLCSRLNGLLAMQYSRWIHPEHPRPPVPKSASAKGDSDVVVSRVEVVDDSFDARFSAVRRRYVYRLVDGACVRDPISRSNQWLASERGLDVEKMREAATHLLGEHDFLSFCRPREGATTIRTVKALEVARDTDGSILISVEGDAFCHNMVRSIVGALFEVGRGAKDPSWVRYLVDHPSRDHGVMVVPAKGLTMVGVDYPDKPSWGTRAREARKRRTLE